MNVIKYLIASLAIVAAIGCAPEDEEKDFPVITDLSGTVWENRTQDTSGKLYQNFIAFNEDNTGVITAYVANELDTPLNSVNFTYTYPLNERYGLTVRFEDGKRFDGYVVQKGNLQIDFKDVYVIQLFEVDDNGQTILDEWNQPVSTMLFWKE